MPPSDREVEPVESTDRPVPTPDAHPHAVFGLDADGRFTEANAVAGRLSGYPVDELVGRSLVDVVADDDRERTMHAFTEVLHDRQQHLELSLLRPDGRRVELAVTGIPWVEDGVVRGVHGVAHDVTERNRTARELDVTRHLAESASQAKSAFVARMSHEIRTPLTSILATVELLGDTGPTPEQVELLTRLQRNGDRLLGLVQGVLDFAGADAAAPEHVTEVFDLHAVLHDMVTLVERSARSRGIDLGLSIGAAVPRVVRDHPAWTTQILLNLLANAVEHTAEGRVDLSVAVSGSDATGRRLVYRVSDTGVGIDPAHHDLIFEPFAQVPSPADAHRGRPGLGLSIVKRLVTISGGTIAVDSSPGEGSTFFVSMPVQPWGAPEHS